MTTTSATWISAGGTWQSAVYGQRYSVSHGRQDGISTSRTKTIPSGYTIILLNLGLGWLSDWTNQNIIVHSLSFRNSNYLVASMTGTRDIINSNNLISHI